MRELLVAPTLLTLIVVMVGCAQNSGSIYECRKPRQLKGSIRGLVAPEVGRSEWST